MLQTRPRGTIENKRLGMCIRFRGEGCDLLKGPIYNGTGGRGIECYFKEQWMLEGLKKPPQEV